MNSRYFFASAAVAAVLAFTTPARAQLLGGGLSGAVGGTLSGGLSGVGGVGGIGGITSTATGTVRDVNSIGRATTQHAHDTVSATADAADRAAANVDKQVQSTDQSAKAAADAAASATSNADANAQKPTLVEPKMPVKESEPVKPAKTEPVKVPSASASVQGSTDAQTNASVEH